MAADTETALDSGTPLHALKSNEDGIQELLQADLINSVKCIFFLLATTFFFQFRVKELESWVIFSKPVSKYHNIRQL